jgi:Endoribonuclease L-PSP
MRINAQLVDTKTGAHVCRCSAHCWRWLEPGSQLWRWRIVTNSVRHLMLNPQELPAVNPTYSQAIKANGLVFVAGQIGIDPATGKLISSDIAEQAARRSRILRRF